MLLLIACRFDFDTIDEPSRVPGVCPVLMIAAASDSKPSPTGPLETPVAAARHGRFNAGRSFFRQQGGLPPSPHG